MLEGFQERQADEMSHAGHMHPASLPSGSSGDGQQPHTQHLHWCHYVYRVFGIPPKKSPKKAGLLLSPLYPVAPRHAT